MVSIVVIRNSGLRRWRPCLRSLGEGKGDRGAALQGLGKFAGAIRRKATCLGPSARANADTRADCLLAKSKYLDYAGALEKGWPIATGIIGGACGYLVADGLDITGPVGAWRVQRLS